LRRIAEVETEGKNNYRLGYRAVHRDMPRVLSFPCPPRPVAMLRMPVFCLILPFFREKGVLDMPEHPKTEKKVKNGILYKMKTNYVTVPCSYDDLNLLNETIYFSGDFVKIPLKLHEKFKLAYPGVDLELEYRRMDLWIIANPNKQKKNYARYALNWLSSPKRWAKNAGKGESKGPYIP
jgi:hypothetical protein